MSYYIPQDSEYSNVLVDRCSLKKFLIVKNNSFYSNMLYNQKLNLFS